MEPRRQIVAETQNADCIIVIMAKAPRLGMVKTRLARHLSPPAVADLYRRLLEDTLTLAHALRGVEIAVMCPAADVKDLRSISGEVRVVAQSGGGLAAALTSVFDDFAGPSHRRVIAFNSDSPHLPASVVEKAFDMLASCALVIGPTEDGGYYLVGARASHPSLFADDHMGTQTALQALQGRARTLGLSVGLTDTFYDVDELDDLNRLAVELQQSPAKAPRTAAWLGEWREALAERRSSTGAS
jgi:uncharacterized protein